MGRILKNRNETNTVCLDKRDYEFVWESIDDIYALLGNEPSMRSLRILRALYFMDDGSRHTEAERLLAEQEDFMDWLLAYWKWDRKMWGNNSAFIDGPDSFGNMMAFVLDESIHKETCKTLYDESESEDSYGYVLMCRLSDLRVDMVHQKIIK